MTKGVSELCELLWRVNRTGGEGLGTLHFIARKSESCTGDSLDFRLACEVRGRSPGGPTTSPVGSDAVCRWMESELSQICGAPSQGPLRTGDLLGEGKPPPPPSAVRGVVSVVIQPN